jgi:UDP-N-acetylglucosamine acyltransferase
MSNQIDPRSNVSPKAQIGNNVSIGPFTTVEDDVIIGDGTTVAGNALIGSGTRLGTDCQIHHGAVVGHMPQDLKYRGEKTICELGDRTVIREYATLHRGTGEGGRTIVGQDSFIMGYCHVAHDCRIGDHVIMSNAAMLAGHVIVEDHVIIGGITPVHQFVRIGKHAMIGGGLRVPKDVPPFVLAGGEPLAFGGLNSVGLRRRGFSGETLDALNRVFLILYRSGLNVSQAVARIKQEQELQSTPEVVHVLDFISASKRGIIAAPRLQN